MSIIFFQYCKYPIAIYLLLINGLILNGQNINPCPLKITLDEGLVTNYADVFHYFSETGNLDLTNDCSTANSFCSCDYYFPWVRTEDPNSSSSLSQDPVKYGFNLRLDPLASDCDQINWDLPNGLSVDGALASYRIEDYRIITQWSLSNSRINNNPIISENRIQTITEGIAQELKPITHRTFCSDPSGLSLCPLTLASSEGTMELWRQQIFRDNVNGLCETEGWKCHCDYIIPDVGTYPQLINFAWIDKSDYQENGDDCSDFFSQYNYPKEWSDTPGLILDSDCTGLRSHWFFYVEPDDLALVVLFRDPLSYFTADYIQDQAFPPYDLLKKRAVDSDCTAEDKVDLIAYTHSPEYQHCPGKTNYTLMQNAWPESGDQESIYFLWKIDELDKAPDQDIRVQYYVSKDPSLSDDDVLLLDDSYSPDEIGDPFNLGFLFGAGMEFYVDDAELIHDDADATIDMTTYDPGTYYLFMSIDPFNEIPESNEENNISLYPQPIVISTFKGGNCDCCPNSITDRDGETWLLNTDEPRGSFPTGGRVAYDTYDDYYYASCSYIWESIERRIGRIGWQDNASHIKSKVGESGSNNIFCRNDTTIHDIKQELVLLGFYEPFLYFNTVSYFSRSKMEEINLILANAFADRAAPRSKLCIEECDGYSAPSSITVAPSNISFDYQCKDQSQSQTVRITNDGDSPVDLTLSIGQNVAGDFDLEFSDWSGLQPGTSFDLEVTYSPSDWKFEEVNSQTLELLYDGKSQSIPIKVARSQNRLIANEGEVQFLPDEEGKASEVVILTLDQPSEDPIVIKSIKVLQSGNKYTLESGLQYANSCIDDNLPRRIEISYDANDTGEKDAILQVIHSGQSDNPINILLSADEPETLANELLVQSNIELIPDGIGQAWGNLLLSLKDVLGPAITIDRVELVSDEFEVVGGLGPWNNLKLEGSALADMELNYNSSRGSEKFASLIIYHDGANNPSIVRLSIPTNELLVDEALELIPDENGEAWGSFLISLKDIMGLSIIIDRVELTSDAFEVVGGIESWNNLKIEGSGIAQMEIHYDSRKGSDKSADLIFHHNGANSPSIVKLSVPGMDKPPSLSISDGNLSFDYTCEGGKELSSFFVTNDSDKDVDFSFELTELGEFSGLLELNTSTFRANSETQVNVTYTADRAKDRSTQTPVLNLTTADTILKKQVVILLPTGKIIAPNEVTLTASADGTAEDTIYFSSSGGPVQIINQSDDSPNFVFEFLSDDCISSGDQLGIVVSYDSSKGTDNSTILTIENNGLTSLIRIQIEVEGGEPSFICSTDFIDFPYHLPGELFTQKFTLKNVGSGPGELASMLLEDDHLKIKSPDPGTLPIQIGKGDSINIEIKLEPSELILEEIEKKLMMLVTGGSKSIDIRVNKPRGFLVPDSVRYEFDSDLPEGETKSVTVTNISESGEPLIITEMNVSTNYFELQEVSLPLSLKEGESLTFNISNNPGIAPKEGDCIIKYFGEDTPLSILLKPLGNANADILDIFPKQNDYAQLQEVVITGTGFDVLVDVFLEKDDTKSLIKLPVADAKSSTRIEAIVPEYIDVGVYDLVVVSRNNIHDDLVLEGAYKILQRIRGSVKNEEVSIATGESTISSFPSVRVLASKTEHGEPISETVTDVSGNFDFEFDSFRDRVWIRVQSNPIADRPITLSMHTRIGLNEFDSENNYLPPDHQEFVLPHDVVITMYDWLKTLELQEINYNTPDLLAFLGVAEYKQSITPIDISSVINDLVKTESFVIHRDTEEWKIEALRRMVLGAKLMRDYLDLSATLTPHVLNSYYVCLNEIACIYIDLYLLLNEKIIPSNNLYARENIKILKKALLRTTDLIRTNLAQAFIDRYDNDPDKRKLLIRLNKISGEFLKLFLNADLESGVIDVVKSNAISSTIFSAHSLWTEYFSDKVRPRELTLLALASHLDSPRFKELAIKHNNEFPELWNDVNNDINELNLWYSTGTFFKGVSEILAEIAKVTGDVRIGLAAVSFRTVSISTFVAVPADLTWNQQKAKNYIENFSEDLLKTYSLSNESEEKFINVYNDVVLLKDLIAQEYSTIKTHRNWSILIPLLNDLKLEFSGIYLTQNHSKENRILELSDVVINLIYDLDHYRDFTLQKDRGTEITITVIEEQIREKMKEIKNLLSKFDKKDASYVQFSTPKYTVLEIEDKMTHGELLKAKLKFSPNLEFNPDDLRIESSSGLEIIDTQWSYSKSGSLEANLQFISKERIGVNYIGITDITGYLNYDFHLVDLRMNNVPQKHENHDAILLSPNPASDRLYLSSKQQMKQFKISDAVGNIYEVSCVEYNSTNCSIDIDFLDSGVYFIKDMSNFGNPIQTFIKIK